MAATILGAASAAVWVYLLAFHGGFWRVPRQAEPARSEPPSRSVVAIIPARDEAGVIGRAVLSLLAQRYPGPLHIIVIDDHSSDGTDAAAAAAAQTAGAAERLTVAPAPPLADGWTGKLWAVHQGVALAAGRYPDYLLLTDADIVHSPDNLARLVARAESGGFDLVSLMVRLHCGSLTERLLIPAFVFFFFKLYPPRRVGNPKSRTAAAAGGCMLVRRIALERVGGVGSIRHEIIDDCALARRIKAVGRVWLGAALDTPDGTTRSIREYGSWRAIWGMIARCAFAQLNYSALLLAGTVAMMGLIYVAPPLLALLPAPLPARALGGSAWLAMSFAFVPVLRNYRAPVWLAPLLPIAALFYTAATISSAIAWWRGRGGSWKGRFQAATAPSSD